MLKGLLSSIVIIFFGIMAKYSIQNDGWAALKKYWWVFIVIGGMSFLITIVKALI